MPGSEMLKRRVAQYVEEFEDRWDSQQEWRNRIQRAWSRHDGDPKAYYPDRTLEGTRAVIGMPPLKAWQHVIHSPHTFVNLQARGTLMANLVVEAGQVFRARGWQFEDVPTETPLEALVNHHFAVLNPPNEWVRDTFERGGVQGCAPLKVRYRNEGTDLNLLPRIWDIKRFQSRLREAMKLIEEAVPAGGTQAQPPPGMVRDRNGIMALHPLAFDPKELPNTMRRFRMWAQQIAETYGIEVPMPPVGQKIRVYRHCGIKIDHIEMCDILWDPRIPTMRDQKRIYQRLVADKNELLHRCKKENEWSIQLGQRPKFDLAAIDALQPGLKVGSRAFDNVSQYHSESFNWLGVDTSKEDKSLRNAVEIIEAWEPSDALGRAYWCWIGQRSEALTNEGVYPTTIPTHPYSLFVNYPTPGRLIGKSDYDIHAKEHDILDRLDGYQMDFVALQLGQPIARKGGLNDAGRKLEMRPFEVFDDQDEATYEKLMDFSGDISLAGNMAQVIEARLDRGQGVDDVLRGQSAQINRVGVGEVQLRASNQQNRPRDLMYRLSTMCSRDLIPYGVQLIWQFGDPDHVKNVAGADPFEMMAVETLAPAMQANHIVMPAALMADAALQVQQLQQSIKEAREAGLLVPGGKATIAAFARLFQLQRIQGAEQILSLASSDIDEAKQTEEAQQQAQQQIADLSGKLTEVRKEADALRTKMNLLTAAQSEAMLQQIVAAGGQTAPTPEGVEEEPQQHELAESPAAEQAEEAQEGMVM